METLAVERSIWIAATLEQVWPALTEPAQLEQWYAVGCPWEIPELKVGAAVRFFNTPEDVLPAVIEALEPPRLWSLRWLPTAATPGSNVVTTFRLDAENGGTRVTINEAGYETTPEAGRREWMEQARAGYGESLRSLAALYEHQGAQT
jgi:uncharacterized protein YndB with AHSA1/START domain